MPNRLIKKPIKKTQPKTREYNNSARAKKSGQTAQRIIETTVELLVERRGGDVPMNDVAKKMGISERTIFRFFKDKKTLHQAMNEYLFSYLKSSGEQLMAMDFVGFAKNAYKLFDRYESLTMAYVLSPFGNEARALFRQQLNKAMIQKIITEKKIELTPECRKRLALVTSLVNAKIWYDIKSDYGLTGQDMSDALDWALTTLLRNLNNKS